MSVLLGSSATAEEVVTSNALFVSIGRLHFADLRILGMDVLSQLNLSVPYRENEFVFGAAFMYGVGKQDSS